MTRVCQIGNFGPAHSTENDLLDALRRCNVSVEGVQENRWLEGVIDLPDPDGFDMLLWTRTWPGTAERVDAQLAPWKGKPIVGYHLDRWFGLYDRKRTEQLYTDPYWRSLDFWFTADPSISHWERITEALTIWTPPAVSERWLEDVDPEPRKWKGAIGFVGAVDGYHPEHTHRFHMIDRLRERYGSNFVTFPPKGQPAIRGRDLAELYATLPIFIGDSCLAGLDRYWSDRVPETLGRGGFLMHPHVDWGYHYEPDTHLICWRLGDWDDMYAKIDKWLDDPEGRGVIAAQGAWHVRQRHTYTHRMQQVLEIALP